MKYDVFELVVIKKATETLPHFFICKQNILFNGFTEVLSGKKIKINEEKDEVIALYKYYSVLAVKNFSTGESLKLSKAEILNKYREINQNYRVKYCSRTSTDNPYGDIGYKMKRFYDADKLVVAKIGTMISETQDLAFKEFEQPFLFETICDAGETKYQEVFTGYIPNPTFIKDKLVDDKLPAIIDLVPLTDVIHILRRKLPNLSLILLVNDLNLKDKKQDKGKEKVKGGTN